jgi:hypothetical protein
MGSVLRQADVTMEIIVFDDSAEGRVRDIVAASGLIRLCITSRQQLRGLRRLRKRASSPIVLEDVQVG